MGIKKGLCLSAELALVGTLAVGCTGNSGEQSEPTPAPSPTASTMGRQILASCKAERPESWLQTPSNFRAELIAQQLNVDQRLVRAGKYGRAICDKQIDLNRVEDGQIVSVTGIGDIGDCLVIGGDRPGGLTANIHAICAAKSFAAPLTNA